MTETPWGPAEELRARRPEPKRGPAATERNHRERLYGAMVATVARKGYDQTTVADLLELSGVSRAAFYKLFRDKEECFVETYDRVTSGMLDVLTAEFGSDKPWPERLGGAFSALLEVIAAQPAAAQMCLVEFYAAGPGAVDRADRVARRVERLLRATLQESPARAELPAVVRRALVGGTYLTVTARVRRQATAELPALVPDMASWLLSYRTPPEPIRRLRSHPGAGGPQFGPYGTVGRIFEAVGIEVADHGFHGATIEGIASQAGASTHTFYKHFDSKLEALLAAYDAGLSQSYAVVRPAVDQARDWPHGLRAGLQALLAFIGGNPPWARASIVEMPAANAEGLGRAEAATDTFATLLEPGREYRPEVPDVAIEATARAIYTIIYDRVRGLGPQRLMELLPTCTYIALAPFLDPAEAITIANHGDQTRRR